MWCTILCVILAGLAAVCAYFYIGVKNKVKNFWPSRGIVLLTQKDTGTGFGDLLKGVHISELDSRWYRALKKKGIPYGGYHELTTPVFITRDLELLRNILVKGFDHFVDRREFPGAEKDEWSSKMLIIMRGEAWKEMRSKMSPTFTTGKIRRMFAVFENSSQRLVRFLQKECEKSPSQDMSVGFGKYTVDVISSAAFGLESGAFQGKASIFETIAEKLQFKMNTKIIMKFIAISFLPRLANLLKLSIFDKVACKFLSTTIKNAIKHRKATGEKRDDFLQLMLETRAGKLKAEEAGELDTFEKEAAIAAGPGKVTLTQDMICGQSILFFFAGFDTTRSLLEFAAYQLAISPEIQNTLADEILEAYQGNGETLTYESVNGMEYMDKFISETLRMYPPIVRQDRKCNKDFKIPGTDLVIPADTLILLPYYAIHHDEEFYPDPFRFDPERFSKEAKATRSPYSYMPFGYGPRNCIGMRFALTEAKLAIAHLLLNFILEPTEKTPTATQVKFASQGTLKIEGGVWVKLKPREIKNC